MLDTDFIDRQAARHASITGWSVVGTWHSHTSRHSTVDPSPNDLRSWSSYYRFYGGLPFLGLIVAAPDQQPQFEWDDEPSRWAGNEYFGGVSEGNWSHPHVGAYIVEGDGGELVRWAADFEVEREA